MIDQITKQSVVTDRRDDPGTRFAHYHCARDSGKLSDWPWFASIGNNVGNWKGGVCPICKAYMNTHGIDATVTEEIHF